MTHEAVSYGMKVQERAVVITRYSILPADVAVWLREGWEELSEQERKIRELVCFGDRQHCVAIADLIRSNWKLEKEANHDQR